MTAQASAGYKFIPDAIGHVLSDRALAVPEYQRSYSWTDEHIEDFWTDLRSAFYQDESEYFLGTIVLSQEGAEGADTIIDGQQRLATTSLLLCAIRDEFMSRGDEKRAHIVHRDNLVVSSLHSGEDVTRLQLNSDDHPFFMDAAAQLPANFPQKALHTSHNLLMDAYRQLRQYVHKTAEDAGTEWQSRLVAWMSFLQKKVRVIVVEVPTQSDAFLIFETLNDRGADLTIADLLKNYLFGRAQKNLNTVRDGWMEGLGALEMSAENSLFTTFLRQYWSSRHGATRERQLFKSIKENVVTPTQAVDFSQELKRAASDYAAILNSDHERWSAFGTSTRDNVSALVRLKLEQIRPLLLAVMQHFDDMELRNTLKALLSWGVRGIIVGGIGGGKTERYYCQSAVNVRNGTIKNRHDLLSSLNDIIPTDDEFASAFAKARVTNAKIARYLLCALERAASQKRDAELVPSEDEERVNLEHILPKRPTHADWPDFSDEEVKVFVDRIGNMVPLSKGKNDKIGNKPWPEKKPILASSEMLLTRDAAKRPTWDQSAIQERQEEMAKLALEAWPREP